MQEKLVNALLYVGCVFTVVSGFNIWSLYVEVMKVPTPTPTHKFKSLEVQQYGGNHYKRFPLEPAQIATQNKLSFNEGSAVKYIHRHKVHLDNKLSVIDLKKAIHYLLVELEGTYGVEAHVMFMDDPDSVMKVTATGVGAIGRTANPAPYACPLHRPEQTTYRSSCAEPNTANTSKAEPRPPTHYFDEEQDNWVPFDPAYPSQQPPKADSVLARISIEMLNYIPGYPVKDVIWDGATGPTLVRCKGGCNRTIAYTDGGWCEQCSARLDREDSQPASPTCPPTKTQEELDSMWDNGCEVVDLRLISGKDLMDRCSVLFGPAPRFAVLKAPGKLVPLLSSIGVFLSGEREPSTFKCPNNPDSDHSSSCAVCNHVGECQHVEPYKPAWSVAPVVKGEEVDGFAVCWDTQVAVKFLRGDTEPRTELEHCRAIACSTREQMKLTHPHGPTPPLVMAPDVSITPTGSWEIYECKGDATDGPLEGQPIGYKVRWSLPDDKQRYLWVGHYLMGDNSGPSLNWCKHAAEMHARNMNRKQPNGPYQFANAFDDYTIPSPAPAEMGRDAAD